MTIHATRFRFWGLKVLDSEPLGYGAVTQVTRSKDGIVQNFNYRRMEIGLMDEVLCTKGWGCGGRYYRREEVNEAELRRGPKNFKEFLLGESTLYTSGPYKKERRY